MNWRGARWGLVLWAVLAAAPGWAEEDVDAPKPIPEERGVFMGDAYRYPRFGLLPGVFGRAALDLISIPSGITGWTPKQWAVAGVTVALTVGLSFPVHGTSGDVAIQEVFHDVLKGDVGHVWKPYNDFLIWSSIWGLVASSLTYGLVNDHPRQVECAALMAESFLVAQAAHMAIKFVTGRQGPKDGDGKGEFGGPAYFFKYYPSGTPSGHVATLWAIFGAMGTYWDSPALNIGLMTAGFVLSGAIIMDDYHYLSEVILGAALGYAIGHWVVVHRSTRYTSSPAGAKQALWERAVVAPFFTHEGGGLAAAVAF